jgi:hypothetical protein
MKETFRRKGPKRRQGRKHVQSLRERCAVGPCKSVYDRLRKSSLKSLSKPSKFNHYLASIGKCMRDCSGYYRKESGGKW